MIEHDGQTHRYGEEHNLPDDLATGPVSALAVEVAVTPNADPAAEAEVHLLPLDALVCNCDTYSLDEAIILFVPNSKLEPGDLAWLIEASLFDACDDGDCDSWETQNEDFTRQARNLANELLLGKDEALIARLREALFSHVTWLIPEGRTLAVTASYGKLALTLDLAA